VSSLSLTFATETVRMTVPYACAALGGIWSEKSGVVNIALEGMLLASALGAVVVQVATGSAVLGLVGAIVVGAGIGAVHASFVRRGVDAIVSGIAVNLVAMGGTRFLLRALYGSSSNSPTVAGFPSLLAGTTSPVALVVTMFTMTSTRLGIQLRAAGEDAPAARSLGLDVPRLRLLAVSIGGGIAGIGGAALAFDQHQFQSGMSGGRGFIALAAVIISGWRSGRAVLACAAFALLDATQIVLQGQSRASHDLVTALPYVATLVSLAVIGRRGRRVTT